jgi:hypothetical protein
MRTRPRRGREHRRGMDLLAIALIVAVFASLLGFVSLLDRV